MVGQQANIRQASPARTLLLHLAMGFCSLLASTSGHCTAWAEESPRLAFRELRRFSSADAIQAVAVNEVALFAITNAAISRHDKKSGKLTVRWAAPKGSPIVHLNSGLVVDGRLYCANSTWPKTPPKNTIEIFDALTLRHLESRALAERRGAINWIERRSGFWWSVFAAYGDDVRGTRLIRYDDNWKATSEWSFPESVVRRFLPNSNSGGAFGPNGRLYLTGHDHAELYVLDKPVKGRSLKHLATVAAPIAGQGIAWDHSDIGTLFGIVRRKREIVAMRLSHPDEFKSLAKPVEWIRNKSNPILPPRKGQFDSTRCMNPWVVRVGDTYRLFYSGGDSQGRQHIGLATASVKDLSNWRREGPLFETGEPGSFDGRWCVLPHALRLRDGGWRMYYTGKAGRGAGLGDFPGIGMATSLDGLRWTRASQRPLLAPSGEAGSPDAIGIAGGSLLRTKIPDGSTQWQFYYTGCPTTGKPHALNQQKTICLAVSSDGTRWSKRGAVMLRDPDRDYENIGVAGPVVHRENDGLFRMWYSAIGSRWGYYAICYAESDDGIHWRRGKAEENLQLQPTGEGWEKQMVEYPTIIREGDRLRLFYCGNGYGRTGIGAAVSKAAE